MLPKWNKGPPASSEEKRWDQLHSVAIWLDMSYKILTHWTWLNCKIFHPQRRSLLHRSLRLLQCSSGYMTFSKSCKDRMILSSWKQGEDISMKPAWTSRIPNSALAQGLLLSLTSSIGCARQGTVLVPVLNPQMSLTLGVQTCSWLMCSTNGMPGFELTSKLPWESTSCQKFQLKPKPHAICATSASLRLLEPNEKVTDRHKGNSGLFLLKYWNFTLR